MERNKATKFLRDTLDANGLSDWHIRLTNDLTRRSFFGMCSYKDKCIILNAHHIDTNPDSEIYETIYHEVAHALTPGHNHDEVWRAKALSLGCVSATPCSHLSFDEATIDAIRSGADVKVEYEAVTVHVPRTTITRLQDKCPTCGKVAIEISRSVNEETGYTSIFLKCFHFIIKKSESTSPFHKFFMDGDAKCKHVWGEGRNRTICTKCNARKLYDYQIEGARLLEKHNGRFAIFDEQGLGKTIQALVYLKYNSYTHPFLWATKSGIKYQHAAEIVRVFGPDFVPYVIKSAKSVMMPGFKAYVISYDLFRRLDLSIFKKLGIKTVVLDECQAIKNPDSSRTQAIREVVREIPHIIPLSGTPWKNRGNEFFVVLNMLDPALFHSYAYFTNVDCDYYYDGNKKKIGGIANPEQFKKKIAHLAIRRERKEVMPELPLVNRTSLKMELEGAALQVYNEELELLKALMREAALEGREDDSEVVNAAKAHIMQMRQIVGIAKVPTTVEFTQEFLEETDRKLVIFVHHIKVGDMIFAAMQNFCKENNMPEPLRLAGGATAEYRYDVQLKFNSDKCRLLIASTLAAGEGLNLQTCSDMVMHERQWNAANEEQPEGRFVRIGQTADSVNATYVLADGTVDVDLDSIVENKRIWFEDGMNKDGYKNTWTEQNLVKELLKRLIGAA